MTEQTSDKPIQLDNAQIEPITLLSVWSDGPTNFADTGKCRRVCKLDWASFFSSLFFFISVNKYELMCLDHPIQPGYPNEDRVRVAFQVLDDLVPKLGVYTRVFTKIKDDLHGELEF